MESMELSLLLGLVSLLYTLIEITAIVTAVIAVHDTRTPQGAIAWAISLITFPLLALPMYWIFGRTKFNGYVDAMRAGQEEFHSLMGSTHEIPLVRDIDQSKEPHASRSEFQTLGGIPYLGGNTLDLHIDGTNTFDAICAEIETATKYILIQFFIVHDDILGKRIQKLLMLPWVSMRGMLLFFTK